MNQDKFGQFIYSQDEILDIIMHDVGSEWGAVKPGPFLINDKSIDVKKINETAGYRALVNLLEDDNTTVEDFDKENQTVWYMPDHYKELDIAEHVLSLCNTQAELQRCGEELLLYQEKNLFNLLRYVKYLVDLMELNSVIWGVGRGSSVASHVLFKLKIHRINSMFYGLDIQEFLR